MALWYIIISLHLKWKKWFYICFEFNKDDISKNKNVRNLLKNNNNSFGYIKIAIVCIHIYIDIYL